MNIADWKKEAFIDYPKKISTVLFASGCNYHCPTCHVKPIVENKNGIDEKIIFEYLDKRRGWINGIVICGGEPTCQFSLVNFLEKIKSRWLAVKLDTNGNNLDSLEMISKRKLVNYIAMDVKGPMSLYAKLTGKDFIDERDDVGKGISIIPTFPDYEFRTTVVPIYEDNKLRWMTPEEIGNTAKLICDWTDDNQHKYFLQRFVARDKEEMLDEKFAKENLPKEFLETPKSLLEECLIEAKKYLPETKIR
jgi:pyruvate formate lyase activating enzyme